MDYSVFHFLKWIRAEKVGVYKLSAPEGIRSTYIKKLCKINVLNLTDPKLAEFIGIILGDGHVDKNEIEITLEHPAELEYAKYIQNLAYSLFGYKTKIRPKHPNAIRIRIYSRKIVREIQNLGLPSGDKIKNRADIPDFIKQDKNLLKYCVRGLVDTDGGFFFKQRGYHRLIIEFKSLSPQIINSFADAVKALGFTPSKSGGKGACVRIQNQEEVANYIQTIRTSNNKIIKKISKLGFSNLLAISAPIGI